MPDLWVDVDTAIRVPANIFPLIDNTDFKTEEAAVAYDAAGMDLVWNFETTAGAITQTPVTPTTAGDYDWTHNGNAMYDVEIPASGGASINNDAEGVGWFTGKATGVLSWRGPTIGFRAAALNALLIDDALSVTRGFTGTALPDAAIGAVGGVINLTWSEALAAYNTGGTSGKILKNAAGFIITDGTAQAGAAGQITLASGESATDDLFKFDVIIITGGTGAGQSRLIFRYTGSSKVALTTPSWVINPDATSVYEIIPGLGHSAGDVSTLHEGFAQAGAAGTITLATYASAIDDFYVPQQVILHAGTGAGQVRIITIYDGTSKLLTINRNWDTNPDSTTEYIIQADAHAPYIASLVAEELLAGHTTADSLGKAITDILARLPTELVSGRMNSNVAAINDSATAAIQLALSANEIESGVCEGTPTTTVIQTDLAEAQDNIYIGRTIIFTSGDARGEATDVLDYAGATGTLTVTALENAPASSDTFILI